MPNLIDVTYFILDLDLPIDNLAIRNSVSASIVTWESEYLRNAMGYAFYKLFVDNKDDGAGRWYDVVNGGEYTDTLGVLRRWEGFKNKSTTPIAAYVYYWWRRYDTTATSSVGESQLEASNARKVDPIRKMRDAWNRMSEQTTVLWDYLRYAKDEAGELVYPEFSMNDVDVKRFRPILVV